MDPCWSGQLQEFLQEALWGLAAGDDFHTGDRWWRGVAWRGQ